MKRKPFKAWGWCPECQAEKAITELYVDSAKMVVKFECGHEIYGATGYH